MARGVQAGGRDVTAMEMTKWFDTNYHYLVPEFDRGQAFRLASTKPVDEFQEAKALGFHTKPVLIGPVTFLLLGKTRAAAFDRLELLDALLPVYGEVLARLAAAGATWVQLDEPSIALDRTPQELAAYGRAYRFLTERAPQLKLLVATYFAGLEDSLATARELPVAGLHVDVVRAPRQLDPLLKAWPKGRVLSLGVIDGRNVWHADLAAALGLLERARERIGADELWVAPSCSLLHVPVDLDLERRLDPDLKGWLAFAKQKLAEVATLTRAVRDGRQAVAAELEANARAIAGRRSSRRIHDPAVKQRAGAVGDRDLRRTSPHAARRKQQLRLPLFPTTTIGSFPQTAEVRAARKQLHDGKLTPHEYDAFIADPIARTLRLQEALGLDVLVHGEAERNDMVEYFGEQLQGFAFTENGWVQSYGSRCVKPPVIYGDVSRPGPMTVEWTRYAQSLTKKPMKGMLTGPITMLQWSFVRDDQPRSKTAFQIALALREEVLEIERAGIAIIQIDEPALREGLPLKKRDWAGYLDWAVRAFKLVSSGVADETQIHTHMCYAEFNDILPSIAALDADVITIETSRSDMELLEGFGEFRYPNEIGPGVYDIHSPRVPDAGEMLQLLEKAERVMPLERLWLNPYCGLKTRGWPETEAALARMVEAASRMRARAGNRQSSPV